MKITYLKLKNFATIHTAMNRKEIIIDFTKCKTNIILLVGANGSGKTSILSTLHPFAYAGTMDIRSTSNIILDDEDGYKEIHIQNNNDLYKIQHYYKNTKRGIILKSFIQKNGEELNPNGNVTSFNEVVKNELSLEQDFLRLLRLGSNVSNLIDMKSTERKNFTSDLLSDINVYNELFKKVSEDNRLLRGLIKTVSDKIDRLNISDKDLLEAEIKADEKTIEEYNKQKLDIEKRIGSLEGRMFEVLPEGIKTGRKNLSDLNEELNTMQKKLRSIIGSNKKYCMVLTQDIDNEIQDCITRINSLKSESDNNLNMINFLNKQLSSLYDEESEIDNKMRLYTSDIEYSQITTLHLELTEKAKRYEKQFKDYIPPYTKDNIVTILTLCRQIDKIIEDIYEFDKNAISKTIELIKNSYNVGSYVNKELTKIDNEILKISAKFKNANIKNTPLVLFKPAECNVPQCPYIALYDMLYSEDDTTKSITSLDHDKEILHDITSIDKNFEYIFMLIKTNMELLNKGNLDILSVNNIFSTVLNGRLLNAEEILMDLISDVEDYEDYRKTKDKIREISAEIKLINNNKENIDLLKDSKQKLFNRISAILSELETYKAKDISIQSSYEQETGYHDDLLRYKEITDDILSYKKSIDTISESIMVLSEKLKSVERCEIEADDLARDSDIISWNIEKLNDSLINKKMRVKEYETLTSERNILNTKFEDINIIKESLSSTKGIPLLFIQLYLKNTKMYVNNLLNVIYSEGFEIDDFEITSTDFNIPYIKNGIRISDVVYASQGEKSFLSLALSFALITQSIKDYNILLLDEIDSTLDIRNRAMFLTILEKQMETIDAEQVFLITHNNMFDNYPVDIILTSESHVDNYNNANIIFAN